MGSKISAASVLGSTISTSEIDDGSVTAAKMSKPLLTARVSTQFDKTNETLANVTGLSVVLVAGRTYVISACLFLQIGAGGAQVTLSGTATATAITWEPLVFFQDQTWGGGPLNRATALGSAFTVMISDTNIGESVWIDGTITVNAGGTLTVQYAQNATNVQASSVLVGSTLTVQEL